MRKKATTTIPAGIEWRKATVPIRIAAMVAPASGIRSRIATISPSATAKGTPMIRSAAVVRKQAVEPVHPGGALEEHEEGHEGDRDRGDHDGDYALGDVDRDARDAEDLRRPARLDRLLDPLLDVVLRLEEAEPAASVRDIVDVARELVDELVELVDEGRDDREADRDEERDREQVGERGRPAAARDAVSHEPFDRRVERERQEDRDQNPGQDVPGDPDHLEDDP